MTRTEAKDIAKDILAESIGIAYYKVTESTIHADYSEEEQKLILEYINKFGVTACKAINRDYITY